MKDSGLHGAKHCLFLYFDNSLFLFTCETNAITIKLIMNGWRLLRGGALQDAGTQLNGMTESRVRKRISK